MDSRTGLSRRLASAKAASPHGHQSTGLSMCCRRYGLVSAARRFVILGTRSSDVMCQVTSPRHMSATYEMGIASCHEVSGEASTTAQRRRSGCTVGHPVPRRAPRGRCREKSASPDPGGGRRPSVARKAPGLDTGAATEPNGWDGDKVIASCAHGPASASRRRPTAVAGEALKPGRQTSVAPRGVKGSGWGRVDLDCPDRTERG